MNMPVMQMVSSSTIEAIGFDTDTSELHVRFIKSGKTYVYGGVSESIYQDMLAAPSIGTFFAQNVRNVFTQFYVI
jgi:hypothetical protein